jgi:hypothetical protein
MQFQRLYGELQLCYLLIIVLFLPFYSDAFHPEINGAETPAHVYVCSVHNISIECGWLHLCLKLGDSTLIVFKQAEEDRIYLPHIPEHVFIHFQFGSLIIFETEINKISSQLCQWLWHRLLTKLPKVVLGKFSLVQFRPFLEKPETKWFSFCQDFPKLNLNR